MPQSTPPPFSLHGYWPIVINEEWLKPAEKQAVLLMGPYIADEHFKANWQNCLTPAELRKVHECSEKLRGKKRAIDGMRSSDELLIERARQRAYARWLRNQGRPFLYGDQYG